MDGPALVDFMDSRLRNSSEEDFDLRFSKFLQTAFDIQTKDWANEVCRSPEIVAFFRDHFGQLSPTRKNCFDLVAYVSLLMGASDSQQRLENIDRLWQEFDGWSAKERDCLGNIYVADALSRK